MSPVSIRDNKRNVPAFLRHFEGDASEIPDLLLVINLLWIPIEMRYCCKDTPMFDLENKKGRSQCNRYLLSFCFLLLHLLTACSAWSCHHSFLFIDHCGCPRTF